MCSVQARSHDTTVLPLADFGVGSVTDCEVNDAPIGDLGPQSVVMETKDGVVMATPGDLQNGSSFDVTWEHA